MITNEKALYDYVVGEYRKYDTELNSLYFDVDVNMPKREILEVYRMLQHDINGDVVHRKGYCEDIYVFDGEYEDIFKGKAKDFLESPELAEKFVRYDDEYLCDFIF